MIDGNPYHTFYSGNRTHDDVGNARQHRSCHPLKPHPLETPPENSFECLKFINTSLTDMTLDSTLRLMVTSMCTLEINFPVPNCLIVLTNNQLQATYDAQTATWTLKEALLLLLY